MEVRFISEVSSNHGRDLERCLEFVDVSAEIGCDAVKFQLFKIDQMFAPEILSKSAKHARRAEWELPVAFLEPIAARCRARGVQFSCTPFYLEAVDELAPYVDFYKVASYELMWDALLERVARTGKPVQLSTGMATIPEIQHAVAVLRRAGAEDVTLFHCVSAYPTRPEEANLAAIATISTATGCPVGWSDHSVDARVIDRAVFSWGAPVVEFHLDLDERGEEFDAGHCWLPGQIGPVIRAVKAGQRAEYPEELGRVMDGSGIKEPTAGELPDRVWRADPSDGLRPLKEIRADWIPD